jgi:hypothetical protein
MRVAELSANYVRGTIAGPDSRPRSAGRTRSSNAHAALESRTLTFGARRFPGSTALFGFVGHTGPDRIAVADAADIAGHHLEHADWEAVFSA